MLYFKETIKIQSRLMKHMKGIENVLYLANFFCFFFTRRLYSNLIVELLG